MMFAYAAEWLNLLLRWFHVVAGMAWIGESFYFVMLDRSLTPPRNAVDAHEGVSGEIWSVHGGGFYHARKYSPAPPTLPQQLHWSKWKSYATWLSGFTLFLLLYLASPTLYLIDPAVARLSPLQADSIAIAFLLAGWLIYDQLCKRLAAHETALAAAMFAYVATAAWIATHVFAGRAAFLITGATLATIMSGNVFFVIIPGQRAMVGALEKGLAPDPVPGQRGRQRSVHNTYFTLPVVFAMISNHYAFTYTAPHAWLVLTALMLSGALVRQFFVLWHSGRRAWMLPAAATACLLITIAGLAPAPETPPARTTQNFAQVASIVARRCAPCHAEHPKLMPSAPEGILLDTPSRITAAAAKIEQQAVQLKAMPLGNLTQITPDERNTLAAWFAAGAPGP